MQDIAGLSRNYKYVLFFDGWIFSGLYSFERAKAKKNGEQYKRWGNYFFALLSGAFQVKDSDKGGDFGWPTLN